ncbi:hypothetical protein [Caulobacter mirabilis]|uniref:hypothetical protein n=1 Tax=Caulobacter mirabilis TaxID=69666 RepID=UPI001FE8F3FF|nr:hypothetical protein [Caulobacter mirabilis]
MVRRAQGVVVERQGVEASIVGGQRHVRREGRQHGVAVGMAAEGAARAPRLQRPGQGQGPHDVAAAYGWAGVADEQDGGRSAHSRRSPP